MSPEFMAGENPAPIKLTCTECDKPAEGNYSWTDGSGDICDACDAFDKSLQQTDQGKITETIYGSPSHYARHALLERFGLRALQEHDFGAKSNEVN